MPELPEVEALRLSLEKYVVGSIVKNVQILNAKLVSGKGAVRKSDDSKTEEFIKNIRGKKIKGLSRRAKNIIIKFTTDEILLVHLKMTGQLVFVDNKKQNISFGGHPIEDTVKQLPHRHTYIIFELSNGTLYYNDVRQFGYCQYYKNLKT